MTLILLQVANNPSLRLLRGLRRNRRSLVDGVIERLPGVGSAIATVVKRLGLED